MRCHVFFSKNSYTQDLAFYVSVEDLPRVLKYKWRVEHSRAEHYRIVRDASKQERAAGQPKFIKLHRFVLDIPPGERVIIDHINDWLDNRRTALRRATHSENMQNRATHKANKTGFKGVVKRKDKWAAQIISNGVKHNLGTFSTFQEAKDAYCEAAKKLHGEFAKLA